MKCGIITGSRADAGALVAVEEALQRAGMLTHWFSIPAPLVRQDSRLGIANAAAIALSGIAKELHDNSVDLVILHGDRYEVLGAAQAAFLLGLPIVHLGGGDVTEGSQDDSIRHAITKLSHLHFATNEDSAKRLVQLGEHPSRVYNVGDPGIDLFFGGGALHTQEATLLAVGLRDITKFFLVGFHPNTLGDTSGELVILIEAIKRFKKPDVGFVLLDPNKDADHLLIEQQLKRLVTGNIRYCENLPRQVYLSTLKHAIALIGNSSAAYYEAPSLATWVINFGDRQKGRQSAPNCLANTNTLNGLLEAMEKAYKNEIVPSFYNPYGDGYACDRIATILSQINPKELLQKQFFNVPHEAPCLTEFGKRYTLHGNGVGTQKKNSFAGSHETIFKCPIEVASNSLILGAAQGQVPGFWNGKDSV